MIKKEHLQAKVVALCLSAKKHTPKAQVPSAFFRMNVGIDHDAHAGEGHRQVSLLAQQAIEAMKRQGAQVVPGSFGENVIIDGLDVIRLSIGSRLQLGEEVILEVTQIGKECHVPCAIAQSVGYCIMPREGVFAKVVQSGVVKPGDRARCL